MMNISPIICFAIVFLVTIVLYYCSPCVKQWSKCDSGLLNLLNVVAVLGAFVSFYYTVVQFNDDQLAPRIQQTSESIARLKTLHSELQHNYQTCGVLSEDRKSHVAGVTTPMSPFIYSCLQYTLQSGEIADNDLRNSLFEIYHRMVQANSIIEHSMTLAHLQVLFPTAQDVVDKTKTRWQQQMIQLDKLVQSLKQDMPGIIIRVTVLTKQQEKSQQQLRQRALTKDSTVL